MSEELRKKDEIYIKPGPYTVKDFYEKTGDSPAELVNGDIVMLSAPSTLHQTILGDVFTDVKNYIRKNGGDCSVFPAPFDVELNDKNVFEPDISVVCDKNKITEKGCAGAPDWVVEIVSPSTARSDYVRKLNSYLDAGVKEYWIVSPMRKQVHVYILENGYEPIVYNFSDDIPVWIYGGELKIKIEQ